MPQRLTATRRGLALVAYSEIPLALGALAFIVFPTRPVLLVVGILLSLLVGAPAGLALWTGRREFGPAFARGVSHATICFVFLLGALTLAFFQITTVFPESLRLHDLYAPWFFLGFAILADGAGILFLLWPLLLPGRRVWLHVTWTFALGGGLAFLGRGWMAVNELIDRSGGVAAVPAEATSYARDFVSIVVRDWAAALLLMRVGFWPALYQALANVAEAERESTTEPSTAAA